MATGTEIKPEDALIGDLVFLSGTGDKADEIVSVGICTVGRITYMQAEKPDM